MIGEVDSSNSLTELKRILKEANPPGSIENLAIRIRETNAPLR
jgi:hypothetical protein